MTYKIKLPIFEGPFDLLLFLIRKHEVDIYDIPIAEITKQYLGYLDLMKMMDLDIAGEFIEMVATLMLIKVRMLLPQPPGEGEEAEADPRADLVAQLLEYQRFKEASGSFGEMEHRRRRIYSRTVPNEEKKQYSQTEEELLQDATLYDLLTAFKTALDNMPKATLYQVNVIKVTIEQQVAYIFQQIGDKPYALFREITREISNKIELIVTFMSLLDLIRMRFLNAKQSDAFGEIRLVPLQALNLDVYLRLRDQELVEQEESRP